MILKLFLIFFKFLFYHFLHCYQIFFNLKWYRSLTSIFYKDSNAAVMVYDITRNETFEELRKYWSIQLKKNSSSDIILAIKANKSDLVEQETVDEEEARNFAKELNSI